jgi:hypothetical protein
VPGSGRQPDPAEPPAGYWGGDITGLAPGSASWPLCPTDLVTEAHLGGEPMTEAGGVGLLPALWRLRIAWVRHILLERSRLPVSSAAAQREAPSISDRGSKRARDWNGAGAPAWSYRLDRVQQYWLGGPAGSSIATCALVSSYGRMTLICPAPLVVKRISMDDESPQGAEAQVLTTVPGARQLSPADPKGMAHNINHQPSPRPSAT